MKDTYLKILLLAFLYMLSADGASYVNTSSVTEECQLVAGVAEYSCAAMVLLVLATCAARGLRSAKRHRHVSADEAGGTLKANRKSADSRINFTTHTSSKKETPHPDYSENLTTHPSPKKETPELENTTTSSGRTAVDQQRQRQLVVMKNLDRLISLMSDDESDTSTEFLLTKPLCQAHPHDQAFYSWSTSSTESSVSIERESTKLAEHSPRKGGSDEPKTPEKQDVITNQDDYSGAIRKRKSDDQKRAVADMSSQTQCEEVEFAALHNVVCDSHRRTTCDTAAQAGTSSPKVTVEVQAQDPESSYGSHRRKTSDSAAQAGISPQKVAVEVQAQDPESSYGSHRRKTSDLAAQAGISPQKVAVEVQAQDPESFYGSHRRKTSDSAAQAGILPQKVAVEVQAQDPESSYGSNRRKTSDLAAQAGISPQKVAMEVQSQLPKSSRDLDSNTGRDFGEVRLERAKKSSQDSESETVETDSEADVFCFLHNVPQQPKRIQIKANSTSKPKRTRNKCAGFREEAKDVVTPVTVYSKKNIVSASKKGNRSEPETKQIKLNKDVSSRNVHYILSRPGEGAMMPHPQYYEESATTMDSTNETSFISNKDLSTQMTQRTQKFAGELVQEPTQWDLLYSFPHPLKNCEPSASKETERCQSKAGSYDDIGSSITGSNSSFERVTDYILSLKPYETSNTVVKKSRRSRPTGSQLDSSTRRELENVQLLNDVEKDSRAHIPENQYNTLSTHLHETNDDCVTGNWRERCPSTDMGLPGEQQMEGQNSSGRHKRDDYGTTTTCQKPSSKAVQTNTKGVSYSQKR